MAINYVKRLAKEHDVPISELEKYWKEAVETVKGEYEENSPKFWGTVVIIFKAKIKKYLDISEGFYLTFKEYSNKLFGV